MIYRKLVFIILLVSSFYAKSQEFITYQNPFYQFVDTNYYTSHPVFNEISKEAIHRYYSFFPDDHYLNLKYKNQSPRLNIQPNINLYSSISKNKELEYNSLNGISVVSDWGKFTFDYMGGFYLTNFSRSIDTLYALSNVLPGMGYSKQVGNQYYGYLQLFDLKYRADSIFSFGIAQKAVKYGYGYTSLFLDDKQSPYLQAYSSAQIWHIKYKFTLAWLKDKDVYPSTENFQRKYMVNHLLSWNIGKRINFNFFESVIYTTHDSTGFRGFDVNYLNPVIFYRPLEFSIGSPDNVLLGLGLNLRIFKHTYLYSQLLLDEFILSHVKASDGWWGNKHAVQAGFKTAQFFNIRNLGAQGEIIIVRPFVFSHDNGLRTYGQMHQLLAYSYGSNTAEIMAKIDYTANDYYFSMEANFRQYAIDSTSLVSLGNNPYSSYELRNRDFNHELFQGKHIQLFLFQLQAQKLLIKSLNLNLFTRFQFELRTNNPNEALICLGITSNFILPSVENFWKKL